MVRILPLFFGLFHESKASLHLVASSILRTILVVRHQVYIQDCPREFYSVVAQLE